MGAAITRMFKALVWPPGLAPKFTLFIAKLRRDDLIALCGVMRAGKVSPVIDRRYALSGAADAITYVEQGRRLRRRRAPRCSSHALARWARAALPASPLRWVARVESREFEPGAGARMAVGASSASRRCLEFLHFSTRFVLISALSCLVGVSLSILSTY